MLRSKRLLLVYFATFFGLFINLLFISQSKADALTITGPSQMTTGSSQTFSVSGGTGSYSWAVSSGGGSFSGISGNSANYNAPTSNYNCNSNPIICVTDSSGQKSCIKIAINAYSDLTAIAYTYIYEIGIGCEGKCSWSGAGYSTLHDTRATLYNCRGEIVKDKQIEACGVPNSNPDCNYLTAVCLCGGCPRCSDVLGWHDGRTPEMKAAGCCPFSGFGGGAGANGPGPGDMGPCGECCNGGAGGSGAGSGSGGSSGGDGTNSGAPNRGVGSEVNFISGNLFHKHNIAGITLFYNSIDTDDGSLGAKWIHGYNLSLASLDNSTILRLKRANGNITYFRLSGGVYYPEAISGDTSQIIKNADGTYTRTSKDGTVQEFNTSGLLTSERDRNNSTTTLTYSGSDLAGITDKNGRTTTITTASGKITGITDAAGNSYTLAYTGNLLTSVTDPLNNVWQYTYDSAGRMLTKKDPGNNTVTYTYDSSTGKLLTATDPEGKIRTVNYNQSGTSTFTEKDGGLWTYTYDPFFAVITAKTDPLGNTIQYIYDLKRNLTKLIYMDGSTKSYTYDSTGNTLTSTDQLGKTTTYTYNSLNLVTSVTDPKGNMTQYNYDAKGNLISITDTANGITQYQYDTKGNITAITNPLGKITSMTYDQNNNLLSVTDPKNGTVTMTYDSMGNMLTQTDALNKTTTFQYNSLNQMTQVTDPLGNVTNYTYDYNGNRLSATDANGNATDYVYNYKSLLTEITDALNNSTAMAYGTAGCASCGSGVDKMTSLTDAKHQITSYVYDEAGRLTQETDPLGKATAYTYDSKGNLIARTNPDGKTTTFTYDLNNRLTKKTYSDGSITVFQYDNAGNMTYAGNANIAYNFTFDAVNRITQITDSNSRTISYQYDAAGNRTAMITPDGKTISYTYDFNNLLTRITTELGNFNFTYDAANRRTTKILPNGTTTTYGYDNGSRLTGIQTTKSGTTIDSVTYTLDNVGNRLTKTQNAINYNYSYDAIYRLTQATPASGTPETYTYDEVGNRLTKVPDTTPSVNEIATYSYDDENRLTGVTITQGSNVKLLTFAYDPFGRRISKTLTKDEIGTDCTSPNVCPRTTNYIYDGQNIIMEYDQAGNITAAYTHGPNIDEPLVVQKNTYTYYYHADGLGSITALSNSSGSIVQTYTYDSFGNITSTGSISQPFTYTGREYDSETGMYFYRARYYDPKVGRFVTKDPIGVKGGDYNLYPYVKNNPVNRIDPLGLFDEEPFPSNNPYAPENWLPKTPGKCISCDLNALNNCLLQILKTPSYYCAQCAASKGKNVPACGGCILATGIAEAQCYYSHCSIKDCCED